MENTQKYIEILKKKIEKFTSNTFDLEGWKSSSSVLIGRIFSNSHQAIKVIEKIEFSSGGYVIGDVSNFWDNMDSWRSSGEWTHRIVISISLVPSDSYRMRLGKYKLSLKNTIPL